MNLPIKLRPCKGDPSEIAILKFVEYLLSDVRHKTSIPILDHVSHVAKYRKENPKYFEIPFNSFIKYQLSVHKTEAYDNNKDWLVAMKGAPEALVSYCSEILINGKTYPLTKVWQRKIDECCKILGRLH